MKFLTRTPIPSLRRSRSDRLLALRFLPFIILTCATLHAEEPGTWVDLFDGKTIDGWVQRGGKAIYTVEDGAIVGTTVPNTPNSFLCTPKDYANFILEVEFLIDSALNCGVQIRSESNPEYKDGVVHGYQVEIDPSDRGWTAGIYDEQRRGWLDDHSDNVAARYAFRQGEWNQIRVEAIGDHIRTFLNGVPAADLTDDVTASGFIALQVHGIGKKEETLQVRYRNVRVQELAPDTTYRTPTPDAPAVPEIVISPDGTFRKLGEGYKFTEGPALARDGSILFNDIPNERTHRYDPSNGEITVYREQTGKANGLFVTPAGALIACEGGARRVTRTDASGEVTVLAETFEGKKFNSPNDVVPDGRGGLYFTDPVYGKRDDLELDVEGVYYISSKGAITRVINDLTRPNGVILSPDGKTLYVADEAADLIWAWTVDGPGKLSGKRQFAASNCDGMSIDRLGNVYVTDADLVVYDPAGKEILRLTPPEHPANCLLVGKTLYLTARTGFYAIDTEIGGVP